MTSGYRPWSKFNRYTWSILNRRRHTENPACEILATAFRTQLWDRLPEWRASLLDITDILKSYLYRLRVVEPAARRFRAFSLFLKRNPDYVAPDVDEMAEPPAWARRAASIRLKARPDLDAPASQELLADIARSLPAGQTTLKRAPKVGALVPDEGVSETVIEIAARPYQRALRCFLTEVGGTDAAVSAVAWKRVHPEFADLPEDIWLLCVLYDAGLLRKRGRGYRFDRVEAAAPPLAGNIVVQDVRVQRASQIQVEQVDGQTAG